MISLSKSIVVERHKALINCFGGINGIRDEGALEASINTAFATFDGIELYPSLEKKAASLSYSLIKNHAFMDGNKRIGIHIMIIFLKVNKVNLVCDDKELIALGLGIADSSITQEQIVKFILNKSKGK